ncbi:MAG: hypothetical protein R3268_07550 [Acidiferrobacterales bacterium]|nr:hypothetical protein [Acidiferrobacterales bacterium]
MMLPSMNEQTERVRLVWADIKVLLEKEKKRIYDEIRNYPPPIAGCDQQYNHLLEERTRLSQELSRMHEISGKGLLHPHALRLIDEFVKASSFIGDETKQEILSRLNEGCAENR